MRPGIVCDAPSVKRLAGSPRWSQRSGASAAFFSSRGSQGQRLVLPPGQVIDNRANSPGSTSLAPPRPSPSLAALTVPPCSSVMWRTMDRPSPKPPYLDRIGQIVKVAITSLAVIASPFTPALMQPASRIALLPARRAARILPAVSVTQSIFRLRKFWCPHEKADTHRRLGG